MVLKNKQTKNSCCTYNQIVAAQQHIKKLFSRHRPWTFRGRFIILIGHVLRSRAPPKLWQSQFRDDAIGSSRRKLNSQVRNEPWDDVAYGGRYIFWHLLHSSSVLSVLARRLAALCKFKKKKKSMKLRISVCFSFGNNASKCCSALHEGQKTPKSSKYWISLDTEGYIYLSFQVIKRWMSAGYQSHRKKPLQFPISQGATSKRRRLWRRSLTKWDYSFTPAQEVIQEIWLPGGHVWVFSHRGPDRKPSAALTIITSICLPAHLYDHFSPHPCHPLSCPSSFDSLPPRPSPTQIVWLIC